MNNRLHKVIFNKNTGLMVAVNETAHNNGKSSGADSSSAKSINCRVGNLLPTQNGMDSGISGSLKLKSNRVGTKCPPYGKNTHSGSLKKNTVIARFERSSNCGNLLITKNAQNIISGSLKPIVIAFSLSLFSPTALAQTQIFADKNAPKNNQAQVLKTASGKAQVNITTPSIKGVSMNQYRQFDVGSKDAVIINNARKSTNTQTAGYINGNPNLAAGEARVIVNQVNSKNPSDIKGYVEIGGKKAELIIANPSGIKVDGGGFINASKTQLVSGKTKFKDGEVHGFTVSPNSVEIGRNGLDVSETEYTQIISAATKVNGKIYGNAKSKVQVNAVSGEVDKDGNGKGTQTVSVDISELGGMYAGKITMVGNQNGFGVNNNGQLIAAENIRIDATGRVKNAGIISANETHIKAKKLNDTGKIQGNYLNISTQEKFSIVSELLATNELMVQSDNGIDNASTLSANRITLLTDDLNNNGKILGEESVVAKVTSSLNNKGEINSNGLTQIQADKEIDNTGKIYGNHTAVSAEKINNHKEDKKEPNGKAEQVGIIAGRNRLDVAAREIVNQNNAELISNGTLHFGATLDANGNAQGKADRLINTNGAKILVKGNATWGVKSSENLNPNFKSKVVEVQGSRKQIKEYVDDYIEEGRIFYPEDIAYTSDHDSKHLKGDERKIEDYWVRDYEQWETETVTDNTNPAIISIGGNLELLGSLKNDKSQILVGGIIYNPDGSEVKSYTQDDKNIPAVGEIYIQNIDAKGVHTLYKDGTVQHTWLGWNTAGTHHKREWGKEVDYNPAPKITPISLNIVQTKPNSSDVYQGVYQVNLSKLSSLYKADAGKNPNAPLIESDPAFTDYRQWLSGQYMLDRLQPDNLMKRIGDGYYEQNLINDQIAMKTGYRYLGGYTDDEEQFKALMDAGIAVADDLQLTVGVKLTAEQANKLTQDIVWYEKQTVTLPDGSTQEVLVPQVYLAKASSLKNNNGTKTLISAKEIDLAIDELNNSAIIQTQGNNLITANRIKNNDGGQVSGSVVVLHAKDELNNDGGSVRGKNAVGLYSDKDISLQTTTYSTENKIGKSEFSRTGVANVSSVTVENPDGIIDIQAGKDINLKAANLESQGSLNVIADGKINSDTVKVSERNFSYGSDEYFFDEAKSQEIGTNAQAAGNINFVSKGDGNYRAVNINSQNGKTQIVSRDGKISVEEGRATNHIETRTHSESNHIVSKKSEDRHYLSDSNEAIHSNITGKNAVIIGSRGDVNIVGANIVSGDESDIPQDISGSLNKQGMSNAQNNAQHKPKTVIYSENGNININAAENRYYSESEHQVKKSGLLGTGGIGITIGTQKTKTESDNTAIIHSGSQIGSLKGDTTIYAGKTYTQTGSTVLSAGGETTISGSQVDIKAAQNKNEDKYRQRFEQKGITVSVSSTLTDFAQTAVNVAKSAEKIGQSKNDRVNAMAAMNSVYSAYGLIAPNPKKGTSQLDDALASGKATAQNLANGNLTNAAVNAGVKLAISYGQQKSQSESNTKSTTAQASEVLGESVNITARENDINIIGSDVSGSLNTDLTAANNINIKSFKETESNRSNNQASGFNAGIALAVGAKTTLGFDVGAKYGKGHENADSTTQRNSHIGSQTGQTNISTGETLNIKGGQVQGQGIQITAKDLNIESQQDTETYHSRQRNASGSISFTGVMPTSGSLNAGQSKINADYASVNEQSGIFAGDDGYQINIQNHTDLTGGIITSTQTAEDNGKNQFTTGSLNATDIQNHALYKGESFAVGIGANYNGEEVKVGSNGIGYGNDSGKEYSVTKSGINTANIIITNKEQQQALTGKSVEETIAAIKTNTTTDNYAQYSGSLNNNFDAAKVQGEIDLQREVTQEFSRNVQDLNRRQNDKLTQLKAQYDNGDISLKEYNEQAQEIERDKTIINMVAGGLLAPTDGILGVATSTVAPLASQRIGVYFKDLAEKNSDGKLTTNQELAHIAAHMLLGATTAGTNGGNALAGALSAGGAEGVAAYLSQTLFDKENPADLDEDERESISAVSRILGATISTAVGDSSLNAYIGSLNAGNAVDNNLLNPKHSWTGHYLTVKGKNQKTSVTVSGDKEIENNKKLATTCYLYGSCESLVNRFGEWSDYYDKLAIELKQQGEADEAEVAQKLASLSQQYSDVARNNIPKSREMARDNGKPLQSVDFSRWNDGRASVWQGASSKTPDYYAGNVGINLGVIGVDTSFSWSAYNPAKNSFNFDVVGFTASNPKKFGVNANFMSGDIMTDEHGQKLSVNDRLNKGKMEKLTEKVIDSGYTSTSICAVGACGGYSETRKYNGHIKSYETGIGVGFKTSGKPDFSLNGDIKGTIRDGKEAD